MWKKNYSGVIAALALMLGSGAVHAVPVISVDMDPLTAGIQSSLTVGLGTTFTVNVVISDFAPINFDTVILGMSYNDAGSVLGAGPTGPLAGTIATPGLTFDVFSFAPVFPGVPLTSGPAVPEPGFTSTSGAIGMFDLATFFVIGSQTIFSLDFTASAFGTSTLSAAGTPFGSPALALLGFPVAATLASGNVTVRSVPEPSTLFLFGVGLVGLALRRSLRRNH